MHLNKEVNNFFWGEEEAFNTSTIFNCNKGS